MKSFQMGRLFIKGQLAGSLETEVNSFKRFCILIRVCGEINDTFE